MSRKKNLSRSFHSLGNLSILRFLLEKDAALCSLALDVSSGVGGVGCLVVIILYADASLPTHKDTPFPISVIGISFNWASAEEAIQRTHGTVIGQQMVRLSWGRSPAGKQDQSGAWGQQVEPSQWAYYNYGYDPYGYAAAQDPYAYGAYAGYGQYPQQVEGATDMTSMAGAVPTAEHREEPYDPLAIPDVDKLNASYLAVHGSALFGRPLWLKTSALSEKA